MKFSIRDLMFGTAIVALTLGWYLDHRHQLFEIRSYAHYPNHCADLQFVIKDLNAQLDSLKRSIEQSGFDVFRVDDQTLEATKRHPISPATSPTPTP